MAFYGRECSSNNSRNYYSTGECQSGADSSGGPSPRASWPEAICVRGTPSRPNTRYLSSPPPRARAGLLWQACSRTLPKGVPPIRLKLLLGQSRPALKLGLCGLDPPGICGDCQPGSGSSNRQRRCRALNI